MTMSFRAWAATLVVIAWGASLGWLALRTTGRTESFLMASQASLRLAPGDAWFAVMAGDVQVGVASVTLDTLSPGYRISETVSLEFPQSPGLARLDRNTVYTVDSSLNLTRMTSRAGTAGGRRWVWTMTTDSLAKVELTSQDTVMARGAVDDRGPGIPLPVLSYQLALGQPLESGNRNRRRLMDGWPFAARVGQVRLIRDSTVMIIDSAETGADGEWRPMHEDTVETKVLLVDGPSGPVRLTIDPRGSLVAREFPFGVRWLRTDFYLARSAFLKHLDSTGTAIKNALPVIRSLTARALSGDTATGPRTYQVTRRSGAPVDQGALELLTGGRQRVSNDRLAIVTDTIPEGLSGNGTDPMSQQRDSAVVALALEVKDAVAGSDWASVITAIRRRVTVDTSATAPSDAAGALAVGRASADGMARLFVALVRANRGSARYAVGVRPAGDTLYTHAWAEVFAVGRGWRAVDPARGHAAAHTDLIRIAWAGSSHPDDFLPVIADVRFTSVTPDPADAREAP
jgi:transglutaminase-like putative cysteine protease